MLTPFRELLKRKAKFIWTRQHGDALKNIKNALSTEAMGYFNKSWITELTTDASPTGLGAVLSQIDPLDQTRRQVILYASRGLSPVECKYSQVEREALAVVWACERLKLYLLGKEFNLVVDNKAVELIYGNPKSKPSARLERWGLRLLPFAFRIRHEPGETNIADYLSRNAVEEVKIGDDYVERYVNMLVVAGLPPTIKLKTVAEMTNKDNTLNMVKKFINGEKINPEISQLKPFVGVKNELAVTEDGVILKGSQIVIPFELQTHIILIGHEGHQGTEKTKQLLNRFVWFPGMNTAVERYVKKCRVCQANSEKREYEPLKMSNMPIGAWSELSADFHGPLLCGTYLLVVMDEYSRYPIVKSVKSTKAETVIPVLHEIFNTFGIPQQIKTDNGPPFQSYQFGAYLDSLGVKHRKITPLWPRANGICERFMRKIYAKFKSSDA